MAEDLSRVLRDSFPDGIDPGTAVSAVVIGMECVARHRELSGEQKKALLVEQLTLLASERGVLGKALELVIPALIDKLVEADKGRLRIRRRRAWLCC